MCFGVADLVFYRLLHENQSGTPLSFSSFLLTCRDSLKMCQKLFNMSKGAFTQSILRGVIRRRLGYLINKKCFFIKKTTILRGVFCPSVNATLVREQFVPIPPFPLLFVSPFIDCLSKVSDEQDPPKDAHSGDK